MVSSLQLQQNIVRYRDLHARCCVTARLQVCSDGTVFVGSPVACLTIATAWSQSCPQGQQKWELPQISSGGKGRADSFPKVRRERPKYMVHTEAVEDNFTNTCSKMLSKMFSSLTARPHGRMCFTNGQSGGLQVHLCSHMVQPEQAAL